MGCRSILVAPKSAERFPPPATLFERGDPRVKPVGRLSPASGRGKENPAADFKEPVIGRRFARLLALCRAYR